MKTTTHNEALNGRHGSDVRISRNSQTFPQTEQFYQSSRLNGGCGTSAGFHRPAFFEISSDYFADEAGRGFAVDTAVFAALIGTALLPIVNGVQAVATLLHTVGVL